MAFPSGVLLAAMLAAAGGSELQTAREAYDRLAFDEAAAALQRARKAPATLTERREIHDLLARCLVAEGKDAEATAIYGDLLREDPNAPPPVAASPTIRQRYDDAKRALFPERWVRLEPEELADGSLYVTVLDPHSLVVSVSRRGEAGVAMNAERMISGPRGSRAVFPPGPPRSVIEAQDAAGTTVASRAFESAVPVAVVVTAPPVALVAPPEVKSEGRSSVGLVVAGVGGAALIAATVLGVLAAQDSAAADGAAFASQTAKLDERARSRALGANAAGAAGLLGVAVGAVLVFEL